MDTDDPRIPYGPPTWHDDKDMTWLRTAPRTFRHPGKLWGTLWERFNTVAIPLQHEDSYFTDALAAAREAETRAELDDLLERRHRERVKEYTDAIWEMGEYAVNEIDHMPERTRIAIGKLCMRPSLEGFVELLYIFISDIKERPETLKKARSAVVNAETVEDDDARGDSPYPTEQEGLPPPWDYGDERVEEGRDDFTFTRDIYEMEDEDDSDKPPTNPHGADAGTGRAHRGPITPTKKTATARANAATPPSSNSDSSASARPSRHQDTSHSPVPASCEHKPARGAQGPATPHKSNGPATPASSDPTPSTPPHETVGGALPDDAAADLERSRILESPPSTSPGSSNGRIAETEGDDLDSSSSKSTRDDPSPSRKRRREKDSDVVDGRSDQDWSGHHRRKRRSTDKQRNTLSPLPS